VTIPGGGAPAIGAKANVRLGDLNGNLTKVTNPDGSLITMIYDKENRLKVHESGSSVATYTYSGDGLKRLELVDGVAATLIWDGTDYLAEE